MATTIRSKQWIDIPTDQTISQLTLLHNVSNTPPNKVVYEDTLTGRAFTYAEFRRQVRITAAWLEKTMGMKPNQIISIISPSCVEYLVAIHACWWVGGIISTINHSLHDNEIHHSIQQIEPDFVLFHDQSSEKVEEVLGRPGHKFRCMTFGEGTPTVTKFLSTSTLDSEERLRPAPMSGDTRKACAAIVLSSGTTGSPKAIMLSHYNLVASCLQLRGHNAANWSGTQAEIFFPPLSHIYGVYVCATLSAWIGAYVCVMDRFNITKFCQLAQDRKATMARLVPPIARLLALDPVVEQFSFQHLTYFSCSAAPLTDAIAVKLNNRFPHVKICQTYGCTELSGPIAQSGLRDEHAPLIAGGSLITNTQARIIDSDGNDVGPRGTGEIWIQSPGLMMGYKEKDSIITSDVLPDGWYRTGDVGYFDRYGYVVITGRTKDVIKFKGFQVAPKELEELLSSHPLVQDAAVIGVWDDNQATELPTAFVVLRPEHRQLSSDRPTYKALLEFAAERVAHYKRLSGGIVFIDELPISPTGKVLKKNLKVPADWRPEPLLAKL